MTEESNKVFNGGVPTDVEMKILDDEYGEPDVGKFFPYGEIERLLKINRKTNRFRTVIDRWRAMLFNEHNLLLICKKEEGYLIANNSERVKYSVAKQEESIRKTRTAHRVSTSTGDDGLSASETRVRDHTSHVAGMLLQSALEQKRKLKTMEFKSLQPKSEKEASAD